MPVPGRLALPNRPGPRPRTTGVNPHQQLDQHAPPHLLVELAQYCFELAHVIERPSMVSVSGARALCLDRAGAGGPRAAFLIGREFAHIHPPPEGSMHLALPADVAREVIEKGWGEPHPAAHLALIPPSVIMLYAPRDERELKVVIAVVTESYRFARGEGVLPA